MIELDSPRWQELQDAYGPATRIPELLRQLESDTSPKSSANAEPWFSLWSALCHQGDAYTASFAAVPHIVRIGTAATGAIDPSFFHLPRAIELARVGGKAPAIPDDVVSDYVQSLLKLSRIKIALDEPPVFTATTPESEREMDDERGLCKQCGHAFNPHLIIKLYSNGAAPVGIMLCPEETCSCFNTWDAPPGT